MKRNIYRKLAVNYYISICEQVSAYFTVFVQYTAIKGTNRYR